MCVPAMFGYVCASHADVVMQLFIFRPWQLTNINTAAGAASSVAASFQVCQFSSLTVSDVDAAMLQCLLAYLAQSLRPHQITTSLVSNQPMVSFELLHCVHC